MYKYFERRYQKIVFHCERLKFCIFIERPDKAGTGKIDASYEGFYSIKIGIKVCL